MIHLIFGEISIYLTKVLYVINAHRDCNESVRHCVEFRRKKNEVLGEMKHKHNEILTFSSLLLRKQVRHIALWKMA